jgi:hypothetical protein
MTQSTILGARLPLLAALAWLFAACAHEETPPAAVVAPPAPSTCPAPWGVPPAVDASLAPPSGVRVVAHVAASGSQNYKCAPAAADAAAAFAWTFVGPEAVLTDCAGGSFGRHFASDAGPPEWLAGDGSFALGKKVASIPSPTPGAVPWLLLQVAATGGAGTLTAAQYVQRVETKGGVMPSSGCDGANAGSVQKVPYTADYWFYGR